MTSDFSVKAEKALSKWQSVVQGDPGNNVWGFFSFGDAPAAIGGGVGTFVWFSNRDEMLSFIADTLPYEPPGASDADWQAVALETTVITDQMKSKEIDDEAGVNKLNSILKTFSQIEWMGTKEDLLSGSHRYAVEVRSAFRDSKDADARPREPIQQDEEHAFYEFLDGWGI